MKNIILLFLGLLVSFSLSAHTEKNTSTNEGSGVKKVKSEEVSTNEAANANAEEAENFEENEILTEKSDVDSSYYTVGKFNYLFYILYKLNYMTDDLPEEEE